MPNPVIKLTMVKEETPKQNRNKFGKKSIYELQTTEILPTPLILSICKTVAYYIGICNSNTKFLEIKQRALKQEWFLFYFLFF